MLYGPQFRVYLNYWMNLDLHGLLLQAEALVCATNLKWPLFFDSLICFTFLFLSFLFQLFLLTKNTSIHHATARSITTEFSKALEQLQTAIVKLKETIGFLGFLKDVYAENVFWLLQIPPKFKNTIIFTKENMNITAGPLKDPVLSKIRRISRKIVQDLLWQRYTRREPGWSRDHSKKHKHITIAQSLSLPKDVIMVW